MRAPERLSQEVTASLAAKRAALYHTSTLPPAVGASEAATSAMRYDVDEKDEARPGGAKVEETVEMRELRKKALHVNVNILFPQSSLNTESKHSHSEQTRKENRVDAASSRVRR